MATTVRFGDVNVEFPKEPYQVQRDYMGKVIEALSKGQNALLESPTGTGKTLCLLTSTIAWQQHARNTLIKPTINVDAHKASQTNKEGPAGPEVKKSAPFTMIRELRTTSYAATTSSTIVGSRDQLCIHEKYKKMPTNVLNIVCSRMSEQHMCSYHNNLDTMQRTKGGGGGGGGSGCSGSIYDIEDLLTIGHAEKVCPYYMARNESEKADIVFLPYNYLIDPAIRNTVKIDWNQSIVIFDEAHNIEKIASDAVSFTWTSTDIATCIRDLQTVLKDIEEGTMQLNSKPGKEAPTTEGTVRLLKALFAIESTIDRLPLNNDMDKYNKSCVHPGEWLVMMLESAGLLFAQSPRNLEALQSCAEYLIDKSNGSIEPKLIHFRHSLKRVQKGSCMEDAKLAARDYKVFVCEDDKAEKRSAAETFSASLVNMGTGGSLKKRCLNFWAFSPGIAMEELMRCGVRSVILTSGTLTPLDSMKEDLKIPFQIELINRHVIKPNQVFVGTLNNGPTGKFLNSSYGNRGRDEYKDELGQSILAIVQTSKGKRNLNITNNNSNNNNNNCSENKSNPPKFSSATSFYNLNGGTGSGSAQNSNNNSNNNSTGCELKGGYLVFFPSYGLLQDAVSRWKETDLFDKLSSHTGAIVIETAAEKKKKFDKTTTTTTTGAGAGFDRNGGRGRGGKFKSSQSSSFSSKASFFNNNNNSNSNLDDGEDEEDGEKREVSQINAIVREFDAALSKHSSCLLLAVCRGKVSEGIDFSDDRGRVVIITGLPYAPFQDPWVVLKKQYLDEQCRPVQQQQQQQRVYSAYPPTATSAVPAYGALTPYDFATTTKAMSFTTATTTTRVARSLTGDKWYQQTAIRAVNQAIGRVIRHNNDWGAIFLLDQRFGQPQQVNQLSQWVRPQMKAYVQINDGLVSFRNFVIESMNNPSLNTHLHNNNNSSSNVAPALLLTTAASSIPGVAARRIPPSFSKDGNNNNNNGDDTDLFTREVVLPAGQFNNNEEESFVNPQFLLTQPTTIPQQQQQQQHQRAINRINNNNNNNREVIDLIELEEATEVSACDQVDSMMKILSQNPIQRNTPKNNNNNNNNQQQQGKMNLADVFSKPSLVRNTDVIESKHNSSSNNNNNNSVSYLASVAMKANNRQQQQTQITIDMTVASTTTTKPTTTGTGTTTGRIAAVKASSSNTVIGLWSALTQNEETTASWSKQQQQQQPSSSSSALSQSSQLSQGSLMKPSATTTTTTTGAAMKLDAVDVKLARLREKLLLVVVDASLVTTLFEQLIPALRHKLAPFHTTTTTTTTATTSRFLTQAEVQQDVKELLLLLQSELPKLRVEECLLELELLWPSQWRSGVQQHMRKRFQLIANNHEERRIQEERKAMLLLQQQQQQQLVAAAAVKVEKMEAVPMIALNTGNKQPTTTTTTTTTTHKEEENKQEQQRAWQPSNRIKRILDATSTTTDGSTIPNNNNNNNKVMSAMDILNLRLNTKKPRTATTTAATTTGVGVLAMTCVVCVEVTRAPCAAKCGHICCANCWKKILLLNNNNRSGGNSNSSSNNNSVKGLVGQCPVCRADVTQESITVLR